MGLDQYAYQIEDGQQTEIIYWRKHNRLHGAMQLIWEARHDGQGDFNLVALNLSLQDIEILEKAITRKELPKTTGFFFGEDSYGNPVGSSYRHEVDDLTFIKKAKKALADGAEIIYQSCY
jgi:hypothetical protein